ncbi:hypothetical protein [Pantoea sp. ACRSB]|uniref:hypothetical protein n=1 Tax=Pantoea sp. ACRSB TaxID=2918207 RepID=UPI0028930A80|nr:hypothetical protein [Pantoea sp. ACRSB]MCG7388116.1 hypothetical protein [Pantoea sp. ACRSB]
MAWTTVLRMLRRMVAIFQEKVMEMRAMLRSTRTFGRRFSSFSPEIPGKTE